MSTTETETAHERPCGCDKTHEQHEADRQFAEAVAAMAVAYGAAFRVSTRWAAAYGGEDANDCAGVLEYDDEDDANEHASWIHGGYVAKRTVISLPWETVRYDDDEEPAP